LICETRSIHPLKQEGDLRSRKMPNRRTKKQKKKNAQTMLTGVAGELQLQHAQISEVHSQGR
jgi:uncharacterized protein (DUF2126 family)